MKKLLKESVFLFLAIIMVICAIPFAGGTFEAMAESEEFTEGYYTYEVENDEATIISCDKSISGDVVIPSELGGYLVVGIGDSAFGYCTDLTNITIPDSVSKIGSGAFHNTAWYDNQPNGDVYAGRVYYSYKGTMPSNTSISLKEGTIGIAESAFSDCSGLKKVTLPDGLKNIGEYAFIRCENLETIKIPYGVTRIEYLTFHGCKSLTSVSIPNSVTVIDDSAFEWCTSLTNVNIPNGVIDIGNFAFEGCTNLTGIIIPDSVTSVGARAFDSCENLENITIPDGINTFGNNVFENTVWYNRQPDGDVYIGNIYYVYKGLKSENTSTTIKDGTRVIADDAFRGCSELTSVTIPNSVISIGGCAFHSCTGLTSITIPNSVISIGGGAFGFCTGLMNITIPNGVTTINEATFYYCTSLSEITIPNSVTDIKDTAFRSCINLKSITIPDSVTSIEDESIGYYYYNTAYPDIGKIENFTIYGHTGTAAETYANENGFTFIALDDGHTHTFSAWTVTKEATCTEEGEETRSCSCGETQTRKTEKKEHSLTHVEEDSTCKIQGVSYDICDMCGNTFNYSVLPLAPHTFGEWKVTKEATSFEYGERMRSCSVCGFEEKERIEKLPVSEVKDEKTGISVICPDGSYDGKVEIEVTETFDGTSYHVLNTEKGNFKKSLFDITTTIDGEKVQPNGTVFVKIPLPDGYNAEKTVVYYVTNDGKLEKIESEVKDGYIIFEATHFSFYAVVDESSTVNPSQNCSCACHKKGIVKFFFKIKLFFQKLFKKNKLCKCGVNHY